MQGLSLRPEQEMPVPHRNEYSDRISYTALDVLPRGLPSASVEEAGTVQPVKHIRVQLFVDLGRQSIDTLTLKFGLC
jgi:hypothetical protein